MSFRMRADDALALRQLRGEFGCAPTHHSTGPARKAAQAGEFNVRRAELSIERTMNKLLLLILSLFLAPNLRSQTMTVETAPPVVIQSMPQSGAVNIDPKTTELRVTFSKEMTTNSWSCIQFAKESWPALSPMGFTKDKRTFVGKISLQGGKTYVVGINSEDYRNFKDASGQSVMPYIIVFRTRD